MTMHYCDIFGDCYHCPASFCPYEKLETDIDHQADDDSTEDANLQD